MEKASYLMKNFKAALNLTEPEENPAAIWSCALWFLKKLGINPKEYYQSLDLKLYAQVKMQEKYPQALYLPGIWPDFGVAAEPSAFGCPLFWKDDDAPAARPAISSMSQVLNMKPVNIKEAGLFPKILETYDYFFKHIEKKYIEEYEHLNGMVFFLGPVETAALIRGYSEFLFELYDNPQLVHKLLDMITTTELEWIKYLETRIGKIKKLYMADHFASQVGKEHFEEFVFPYIKRIFDEYPNAIKLYHNEGNVSHVLSRIPDMGADIFHFGTDIKKTKQEIGGRICLLGNLDPVGLMQMGTPRLIETEAFKALEEGGTGGGFILCSAGAFGVDIPDENVDALLCAPKKFRESQKGV